MDMRRFLIAGQLDGQNEALTKLHALVRERRPDGVLVAGALLAGKQASHKDRLKKWEDAFDGLGGLDGRGLARLGRAHGRDDCGR